MKIRWTTICKCACGVLLLNWMMGCGGDGGGGGAVPADWNFGDNNPNVVVCMGDSITAVIDPAVGATYPQHLAAMFGGLKTVVNEGRMAERSIWAVERIGGVLAQYKPGLMCILYGANDVIMGHGVDEIVNAVVRMALAARANQTYAVVGLLTPITGSRMGNNGKVQEVNAGLRMALEMNGIPYVDLYSEFDGLGEVAFGDGLHFNNEGARMCAAAFFNSLD